MIAASFGILIYAQHPDICVAHYRIARYVLNVGRKYLINHNLQDPQLSGAELAPDPRYIPDQLYVRRLTLQVDYEEHWDEEETLTTALARPLAPERLTTSGTLLVGHEDSDANEDGVNDGGFAPYTED